MTLTRRHFMRSAALMAAAAPLSALAHHGQPHIPRIYMILYRGETPVEQGFSEYFADQKLETELIVRNVELDTSRVPALLAEARALGADLIYTWGTPVTLAVAGKEGEVNPDVHETEIPIVFTMVAAPRGAGVVSSLVSSRRNVTGASHMVPVRLQMNAIQAWRRFRRIGIIYTPNEPNSQSTVKDLRAEMAHSGCVLLERAVPLDDNGLPQADAIPGLVSDLARQRADLLYIGPDSFLAFHRHVLTQAALDAGLPTYAATEVTLRRSKAMFGLVSGYNQLGRLTAHKAAQILFHGVRPDAIPVETLASFSYLVNTDVAGQLGITPPKSVLQRAELIR
jgi:putative ABC transport system substrate-binding protein